MSKLSRSLSYPFRFVAFLWIIFFIEYFSKYDFSPLGIFPRDKEGLVGILFAPLLHGNFLHLLSNSVPLLILGTVIYLFYDRVAGKVFFFSYFATGVLVWIFGRPSFHLGASGLVYGLAFFLFFIGVFRRDVTSIIISIIMAFLYGGIVYGMLPFEPNVSWESHLMGAFVGVFCAFNYRNYKKVSSKL